MLWATVYQNLMDEAYHSERHPPMLLIILPPMILPAGQLDSRQNHSWQNDSWERDSSRPPTAWPRWLRSLRSYCRQTVGFCGLATAATVENQFYIEA